MKRMPRCSECKRNYSDSSGKSYHLPLQSVYIRKRNGKIVWIKVGYWCRECKKFYTLEVEKEAKRTKKKK